MFAQCSLLVNKITRIGHSVSHSNVKTKRRFKPNLQNKSYFVDALNKKVYLKLSTTAIRTIDKYGSLQDLLLSIKPKRLTAMGKTLKKQVLKRNENVA